MKPDTRDLQPLTVPNQRVGTPVERDIRGWVPCVRAIVGNEAAGFGRLAA